MRTRDALSAVPEKALTAPQLQRASDYGGGGYVNDV